MCICSVQTDSKKDTKEKKPQKMKNFIDEVVKSHNKYRKQHGKVSVQYNELSSALTFRAGNLCYRFQLQSSFVIVTL